MGETSTSLDAAPSLVIEGATARITFRRPETHNRLNAGDVQILQEHFQRLNDTPAVRVLVLTGTGPSFSSGFDLRDFEGQIANPGQTAFESLTDNLEALRPITIARLQGPVYGGSTDLALACDFRIATTQCRMFMPAARLGLHYYGHGLRRWVARLGAQQAKRLFLTAEQLDAAEMLAIGFVNEVVPPDALDERVSALADRLLSMAPVALLGMKQTINDIANGAYEHSTAEALHKASVRSKDLREALDAFAANRKPAFVGA